MAIKPALHKGTRDFTPVEVAKREYIFNILQELFRLYGFEKIETPIIEKIETLTGKYGDEGDKLLFKLLNSGDYMSKVDIESSTIHLEDGSRSLDTKKITPKIIEKGLRYDLTVPLARYVVMHREELTFPFRRFHIGQVYRADRPQRGRYQEFYQCDADIIGTESLLSEVDLLSLFTTGYTKLGIHHKILVNNRKILQGIIEIAGLSEHFGTIVIIIDKLDKIGEEGVRNELFKMMEKYGISESSIDQLMQFLQIKSLEELKSKTLGNQSTQTGIDELVTIFSMVSQVTIEFDITLARGIDYYTGCIYEVKCTDAEMGSIGSGGRYANLTEMFGAKDMSGVGISFGIERIYDIMEEKNLFPTDIKKSTTVLITNLEDSALESSLVMMNDFRSKNISAELYPSKSKLEKQMKYANGKGIQFVIIIGENEIKDGNVLLKNMDSGEQKILTSQACLNLF